MCFKATGISNKATKTGTVQIASNSRLDTWQKIKGQLWISFCWFLNRSSFLELGNLSALIYRYLTKSLQHTLPIFENSWCSHNGIKNAGLTCVDRVILINCKLNIVTMFEDLKLCQTGNVSLITVPSFSMARSCCMFMLCQTIKQNYWGVILRICKAKLLLFFLPDRQQNFAVNNTHIY